MENMPVFRPTFFIYLNTIPLNADVTKMAHQLFVANFSSLPLLLDGAVNEFGCIDLFGNLVSRNVSTGSKLIII